MRTVGKKAFDENKGSSSVFGRNPISTALCLQHSLDVAKKVWCWMKKVKSSVDWQKC